MATEDNKAIEEAEIRRQMDGWVRALRAKDIDGVMSFYAPNIVSFDLDPPLRYAGADNKRRAWQELFAAYTGPIAYEVHDLNVTTHGELAFVHSLNHVNGTLASGHTADMWVRWTACFRRIDRLAGGARPRVSPSRPGERQSSAGPQSVTSSAAPPAWRRNGWSVIIRERRNRCQPNDPGSTSFCVASRAENRSP